MGDVTGMSRRFDVPTYLAESAGWNVEKLVNVAAATGRHSVEETLHLDRRADVDGHPDAIVGGIPPTESTAEAVELIDRQMSASRFRGASARWGSHAEPLPDDDVLRALQERGLLFELMAHPDQLQPAAARLGELRRAGGRRRAHRVAPIGLGRGARAVEGGHGRARRASVTTSSASCRGWRCRSAR